jgi:hypothetical protein
VTVATGAATATITPAGCACISAARRATSRAAAATSSTPAAVTAAISPTLCPTTAAGVTPTDAHHAVSATSTAHSAGCAHSVSAR